MLKLATVLVVLLALGVAVVWLGQRYLIYRPDVVRTAPASEGLTGVSEVELTTPDGERLVAWYVPARGNAPTVLYFQGNGGGPRDRAVRVRFLQDAGYGVLMLAYRGYAGSSGTPTEAANIADAGLAYDWLRQMGVTSDRIVLFGESLGSGIAVLLAASKPVAGVILDSPYTSLVDVATRHFPYLGLRWLLRDRYVSIDHIAAIGAPLLILHGEKDGVVPFSLGRRLFEAAREPKRFVAFAGVGHLVPFDGYAWPRIRTFLQEVAQHRAPA